MSKWVALLVMWGACGSVILAAWFDMDRWAYKGAEVLTQNQVVQLVTEQNEGVTIMQIDSEQLVAYNFESSQDYAYLDRTVNDAKFIFSGVFGFVTFIAGILMFESIRRSDKRSS